MKDLISILKWRFNKYCGCRCIACQYYYHCYAHTLIARLKWWINKENKYCKSCCLFCRYFIRCQIDVAREKE